MKYKVCSCAWEYAQVVDGEGSISMCPWSHYPIIGKLTENTMYEIWHGEKAQQFRESFLDGSYRYCVKEWCPFMSHDNMEEVLEEYDSVPEYPLELSLSSDNNCNYFCPICTKNAKISNRFIITKENQEKIDHELSKFINKVVRLSSNGRGELFVSKHIMETLSKWKPERPADEVKVGIETNGSLFDAEHFEKIKNLGQYNMWTTITVMSFDQTTYQMLSGSKLPIQKIIDNLHFVKSLREQGILNHVMLRMVVQERNFREMPSYARRCLEEFGADKVDFRAFFPVGGALDTAAQWFYDIRNPYHPYFEEYKKILEDPIFKDPRVDRWAGDELSKIGPYPYQKDHDNFEIIKYFAIDDYLPRKIADYFDCRGIDKISAHGFGFNGEAFVTAIEKTYLKLDKIIDKCQCGCKAHNRTIVSVSDLPRDYNVPIVVTAPSFFDEIKKEIEEYVDNPCIFNLKDIIEDVKPF